jgi:hypothetical protein
MALTDLQLAEIKQLTRDGHFGQPLRDEVLRDIAREEAEKAVQSDLLAQSADLGPAGPYRVRVLRWLAVCPGSLGAGISVSFLIHWITPLFIHVNSFLAIIPVGALERFAILFSSRVRW